MVYEGERREQVRSPQLSPSGGSMRCLPVFVLFLLIPLLLPSAARAQEASDELAVIGEGAAAVGDDVAAAEEEAVWDAKRNAVEQAAGIFLKARTIGRDF